MLNEILQYHFQINHRVALQNVEGITHEESLVFGLPGGSCINRVLGHMVATREKLLEILGKEKVVPTDMYERYKRGANEITPEEAMPFEEIISYYNKSQPILEAALLDFNFQDFEVLKRVQFLAFHEGYHVGQLGIMRRFVGKEGVIK